MLRWLSSMGGQPLPPRDHTQLPESSTHSSFIAHRHAPVSRIQASDDLRLPLLSNTSASNV
jgi:hypothetical protein